ncbi:hypothetical protein ONS95_002190 [Cadophora gregata]|uniref:uncharacterized protein n=1 Tax=Cadophora gregata TaxID=51156 RepID=UPI0026DD5058|nr:uncharacterized protein ONS95_002190 [Cadophora gregata]KAK0109501.1 hypothetical protein ONS95_002190 [Cadophora gregata]
MTHEIKPWYMAFKHDVFAEISRTLNLPETYLFMRAQAGGAGNFAKYSSFNTDGSLSRLGFVIRVPHSPRYDEKAIWSMAISWNSATSHSSGLFEGVSDADIQEIVEYLTAKKNHSGHPLALPTMMLDLLMVHYTAHRRELESSLFLLETQLGITRGTRKTDAWDWGYDLFRESTKHCNGVYTGLVYLERRLQFASGLSKFLLSCLIYCGEENMLSEEQKSKIRGISRAMKENIQNNETFLETQLQHVLCLQKQSQALITVIYTIVAQKDSRVNLQIAKAAKRDSSSMTALAVLGIVFLPAMLIASMFSMSMFDFSPSSDQGPRLSSSFWMYWAVTLPLTLILLGIWKARMYVQSADEDRGVEPRHTEEKTFEAIRARYQPDHNTPFYPSKGLPGHIHYARTPTSH